MFWSSSVAKEIQIFLSNFPFQTIYSHHVTFKVGPALESEVGGEVELSSLLQYSIDALNTYWSPLNFPVHSSSRSAWVVILNQHWNLLSCAYEITLQYY